MEVVPHADRSYAEELEEQKASEFEEVEEAQAKGSEGQSQGSEEALRQQQGSEEALGSNEAQPQGSTETLGPVRMLTVRECARLQGMPGACFLELLICISSIWLFSLSKDQTSQASPIRSRSFKARCVCFLLDPTKRFQWRIGTIRR